MPAKFTVYKDKANQFRFNLKAGNGEIIAVGESYPDKKSCLKGIASIQKNAPVAKIVDSTLEDPKAKGKKDAAPNDKKAAASKGKKAAAPKDKKTAAPKGKKAEAPKEKKAEAPKEKKAAAPKPVPAPKAAPAPVPVPATAPAEKVEIKTEG